MAFQIPPNPKFQQFDANGNPLTGGKLYTYLAGSSNPVNTYTDSSGSTANTNPVILNARGEADVWVSDTVLYKFVLTDASDVEIWSVDNISATAGGSGGGGANDELVRVTGSDLVSQYLSDKLAAGPGIALNVLNPGGVEQLQVEISQLFGVDITNDSSVAGANVKEALDTLLNEFNNIDSDGVSNLSSVAGANVTNALDDLQTQISNVGTPSLGSLTDVTLTNTSEGQSLVYDGTDWTNQVPIVYVEVNNGEATAITRGQPVYVSGSTGGGTPVVSLADNDGVNTYPAIGLVADNSIGAGADGRVLISGILENVDTSTYNVGDAVYLDSTAGDLTSTRPTSDTEKVQKVGLVTRQAVSGSILVIGAGRTNDVPNELTSLTGVALNDTDLGTFTGSIIPANRTIKEAFQDVSDGIEDSTTQNPGNSIVAIYKGYDTTTVDPNNIVLNQGEFVIWTPPGSPSTEKYFIFHPTGLDGIDYTTFFQDLTYKSVISVQDSVQNNWKISLTFTTPSQLTSNNFIFFNASSNSLLYDTFTSNATLNSTSVVGFDHRAEIQDSGIDGAFLTKDTFGNYTFTDGFGTFPSVFRWDQGNQKFEWYDSIGSGSNRLDFEGQHNYLETSIVSFFNASQIQEAYFQWDSLNNTLGISTNALGGTANKLSLSAGGELWLTSGVGHPIKLFGDTTIDGELSVSNILPGTQVGLVGYDATGKLIDGTAPAPTAGGSNTEVQFNDNGVFGGDSYFTFDKTTNNVTMLNRFIGGVGAETTAGTQDFDAIQNRRSGSGYTLLRWTAANAPQQSAASTNDYWHTFNFEYGSTKTGSTNLTQIAIPYGSTAGMGSICYRSRYNLSGNIVYTGWRELIASHESATERVFLFPTTTNNTPTNGDIWFDGTNFKVHENGNPLTLAKREVNNNFSTDQTIIGDLRVEGTNTGIEGNKSVGDYFYMAWGSNADDGANIQLSNTNGHFGLLRIYNFDVLEWRQNYIESKVPIRFNGTNPTQLYNGEIWYDGTNMLAVEGGTSGKIAYKDKDNNFSTDQAFQGDINASQVVNLASYNNSSSTNGDVWYDSTTGKMKSTEDGVDYNLSGTYEISTETDLNNYQTHGSTLTPSTALTNAPAGFSTSGRRLLQVNQYGLDKTAYMVQTLYSMNDNKVAWRVYNATAWSDWHEVPYMVDDVLKLQNTTNSSPTAGDIWRDSTSGAIEIEGDTTVNGDLDVTGSVFLSSNRRLYANSYFDLEDETGWGVRVDGTNDALRPLVDNDTELGLSSRRWSESHVTDSYVYGDLVVTGNTNVRIGTTTSTASLSIDTDLYDQYNVTALAVGMTINAPTNGSDGKKLIIRIKDSGSAQSLTWNAIFRAIGVTLPNTTTANKTIYVGCIYNNADSKWDAIAVAEEA